LKREVRFLGIDDSPFVFGEPRARIVGVVTRGAAYVEGVLSGWVDVDGTDATAQVISMVASTRFRSMLRAIFLNGVTMGGFNLLDLDEIHRSLGVPVVSVVRDEPDQDAAAAALRKYFPDGAERAARLRLLRPVKVLNGRHAVWVNARGVAGNELEGLLILATVRGAVPEPIRLAHVIASGIARGESRGPA
jgi:uncharacterized protein